MSLVVGTNTYASLADVQEWLTARGYALTATEASVLKAMDYLESLNWVDPDDVDVEVDDDATLYWGDDPPAKVIEALYWAVKLELESSGVLAPSTQKRVKSEAVDVVRVEYEPGGYVQQFPVIQRVLRGYVQGSVINVRLA